MTENTVDEVVAEATKKARPQVAEPVKDSPLQGVVYDQQPLYEIDPVRAKRILRAMGNLADGELAWLARRIEAAREREKHRRVRPPERHGGRPFREDEVYD